MNLFVKPAVQERIAVEIGAGRLQRVGFEQDHGFRLGAFFVTKRSGGPDSEKRLFDMLSEIGLSGSERRTAPTPGEVRGRQNQ
ncbi:MAG TPA: hypothetical protein VF548_06410 [Allosphingosinicella sp.]|jgi:hypothetical protein